MKRRKCSWLILIFTLFLFACGGGGGDGSDDPGSDDTPTSDNTTDTTTYATGNQDFELADAMAADPLGDHRTEAGAGDALPSQVDYSTLMPRVRTQGRTGSCTAWASGYYTKSYQEALEEGWDIDDNAFSPAYLYAMQCRHHSEVQYGDEKDFSPQNIIVSYGMLKKYGCVKWNMMPYEDLYDGVSQASTFEVYADLETPEEFHEEARIYRCGDIAVTFEYNQIKNLLTQGPAVATIWHYDKPPQNPSSEENYMRPNPEEDGDAHAVALVGYDDTKFGDGAFKFINSWGEDWAEDGFSWIKYADAPDIIAFAISFKDIVNPNNSDDSPNADERPDQPGDVDATDDAGSYVDVTWSPVSGANYYIVYRAEVDGGDYENLGMVYEGNFRDYPTPGTDYYYAVVAVNDLGESDFYAGDTDSEGYIDIGSATGDSLSTPRLTWDYNEQETSYFTVSNIDAAATAMEVLVSKTSSGPWESFGWITPEDFDINWDANSEYINKAPYVRVRVSGANASSDLSTPVQVGEEIPTDVNVGYLRFVVFDAQEDSMLMYWTIEGNIDYVEVYRYCASSDNDDGWVKIGYQDSSDPDEQGRIYFEDTTPTPGIPYYYAIVPVYQSTYGTSYQTTTTFEIETDRSNLNIASFQYSNSQQTTDTNFENVVIRNNGCNDISTYSIGIMAMNRKNGQVYEVDRRTITVPLAAGAEQRLDIGEIEVPAELADGGVYSWGIQVDCDESNDEVYESDNTKWSSDGWWLSADTNADATANSGKDLAFRLNSTRRFKTIVNKQNLQKQTESDSGETVDEGMRLRYNGPAIYNQPAFFTHQDDIK